jgi:hypothetical protein
MLRLISAWVLALGAGGCTRRAPVPTHESPTADVGSAKSFASAPADSIADVIQIGAAWHHTCALRHDGKVYCWGRLAGIERNQPRPRRVNGIESAQKIAIGGSCSYALEATGDVVSWGGLTGPHYRHRRVEPRPSDYESVGGPFRNKWQIQPTEPLDPALSAEAAAAAHSDEVHLDTREYGASTHVPPQWRVTARAVPTRLRTDGTIFLAGEMLCTHDRDGSLACVRPHFHDAFPWWNESQSRAEPDLVDIASTSMPEVCLLRRDGGIECVRDPEGEPESWGDEDSRIDRVPLPGPAAAMASGDCGMVLLEDGRLVKWCELDDDLHLLPTPTIHSDIDDGVAIDSSIRLVCVIRRNHHITCWWEGRSARLPAPRTITTLDHPTQIAVGLRHACALVAGGHVQCWGANEHGQLGNGGIDGEIDEHGRVPLLIPDTPPAWVVAPEQTS